MQVQSELARLVQVGEVLCHTPTSPITSPDLLSSEDHAGGSPLASDLTSRAGLDVFVGQSFNSTAPAGSRHGSSVASGANGANGTNGNGGAASAELSQVYVVPADGTGGSLRFYAATIAPLVATYAAVLRYACARLQVGVALGRAEFSTSALQWIRDACAERTSAVGAIPSQLIVQHAVEALIDAGCLQAQEDGAPAVNQHFCVMHALQGCAVTSPRLVAATSTRTALALITPSIIIS